MSIKEEEIKIRKILVAIDGSEKSDKALNYALWLSKTTGSEVEILNVLEPVKVPTIDQGLGVVGTIYLPGWVNTYYKEFREHNRKVLEKRLQRTKENYPDLMVKSKMVEGFPASEIVKEAEENDFDLIVMGSRGLSGLEELVLGSVSDAVVNKSKVPVFIVK
jgi:nucleotide-binding universal stress UspA family protein